MTIVVTGATGNVGRPLISRLIAPARRCGRSPTPRTPPNFLAMSRYSPRPPTRSEAPRRCSSIPAHWPTASPTSSRGARLRVSPNWLRCRRYVDDDLVLQPSRFRGDRNKEVEQLGS
ncbi:MAG: nucleoside-diphosphate sugar epimerase, partial [Mycobacteriaceae bacterium]|nr:nucleoside-diphosphate sugar epimerase [Mycobacteriaceae bacterium]